MNTATTMRSLQRASQTLKTHYAPFRIPRLPTPAQRCLHLRTAPPPLLRNCKLSSRIASQRRYESTSASANPFEGYRIKEENGEERPLTDEEVVQLKQEMLRQSTLSPTGKKEDAPAYKMTFTCRQCLERSSHNVSKQAYHFGTCLITCPGCKNRHLISDHLKVSAPRERLWR